MKLFFVFLSLLLSITVARADGKNEMINYGGASHGFTVFGTDRYREDADKASWQRFLTFLKETL